MHTVTRTIDGATVRVHADVDAMARAAADEALAVMQAAVAARGTAHVMFATGNSQLAFVRTLVEETAEVPWRDTVVFHMDEYVGVGPDHRPDSNAGSASASSNRRGRRRPTTSRVSATPGRSAAATPDSCATIRWTCVASGSGRTGTWPSTTPPSPNSRPVGRQGGRSRHGVPAQQVNEGHFADLESVPAQAITVTIPALLARAVLAIVPEAARPSRCEPR